MPQCNTAAEPHPHNCWRCIGDVRNPLGLISTRFDTRTGTSAQGGDFSFSRYFRGPTALFGGVQYHTPWDPLTIKVEYEGNDYRHEHCDPDDHRGWPATRLLARRHGGH